MPSLHLLGTGAGYSDATRTTTMLALSDEHGYFVIDCGGDVVQRILAASLPIEQLDSLIITHEHPDHVGGFPLFMEKIWLSGRKKPIDVYGPEAAIAQAKKAFDAFNLKNWKNMVAIHWHRVSLSPYAPVFETERWKVTAIPTVHPVDTIGLNFEYLPTQKKITYTCDTAPFEALNTFAQNTDILVHEATEFDKTLPGVHSSFVDAATTAKMADAKRLILVHLPPNVKEAHLEIAKTLFDTIEFGEELGCYPF